MVWGTSIDLLTTPLLEEKIKSIDFNLLSIGKKNLNLNSR